MTFLNEIDRALQSHAMWRINLLNAIDAGKTTEFFPEIVVKDDACHFGKWLHSNAIPESAKSCGEYAQCLALHKEFHIIASQILTMAIEGKRLEALAALAEGSEYSKTSSRLIHSMKDWAAAFEKQNSAS